MSKEKISTIPNHIEYDGLEINQLGEILRVTGRRLARLRKKERKFNKEYNPVRSKLDAYAGMWGEEALRDLGKRNIVDEEWRNRSGHRDLYFQDIRLRSKRRKIDDKIRFETSKYDYIFELIKQEVHMVDYP